MRLMLVCLIIVSVVFFTDGCHTFHNTMITAQDKCTSRIFGRNITGCLERKSFDGENVKIVYIEDQNIPVFDVDAVRHLIQLQTLTISNTLIGDIRPRAFRNVPRLQEVDMINCDISEIPEGTFNTVTSLITLDFHGNRIALIEDGAFKDLVNLRNFNISNNVLFFWSKEWFRNTTSLEIIDFSHNEIIKIAEGSFEELPRLRQIYFDYNDISAIERNAFKNIRFLHYLGLRHNKLASIDQQAFPNHIRISSLHIEANRLTFFPEDMLDNVKMEELTIHGNPLNCYCLKSLMEWIHQERCKVLCNDSCIRPEIPICVVPTSSLTHTCSVISDENDVGKYFRAYRTIQPPVDPNCARLE